MAKKAPKPDRTEAQKAATAANLEKLQAARADQLVGKFESEYNSGAEDDPSEQLALMRHVGLNGKKYDSTGAHRTMREFQDRNPVQFNAQWTALEEKHKASQGGGSAAGVAADLGTDRVLELVGGMLKEYKG